MMGFTEELTLLHPTLSDYSAPPQHTPPGKAVARLGFSKTEAVPQTKMTFFPLEERGQVLSLASIVVLFSKEQRGSGRLLRV